MLIIRAFVEKKLNKLFTRFGLELTGLNSEKDDIYVISPEIMVHWFTKPKLPERHRSL